MSCSPWIIQAMKDYGRYNNVSYDPQHSELCEHPLSSLTVSSPSGERAAVTFFVTDGCCIIIGMQLLGQING